MVPAVSPSRAGVVVSSSRECVVAAASRSSLRRHDDDAHLLRSCAKPPLRASLLAALDVVPDEIVSWVFAWCAARELATAERVSRAWRARLSRAEGLWLGVLDSAWHRLVFGPAEKNDEHLVPSAFPWPASKAACSVVRAASAERTARAKRAYASLPRGRVATALAAYHADDRLPSLRARDHPATLGATVLRSSTLSQQRSAVVLLPVQHDDDDDSRDVSDAAAPAVAAATFRRRRRRHHHEDDDDDDGEVLFRHLGAPRGRPRGGGSPDRLRVVGRVATWNGPLGSNRSVAGNAPLGAVPRSLLSRPEPLGGGGRGAPFPVEEHAWRFADPETGGFSSYGPAAAAYFEVTVVALPSTRTTEEDDDRDGVAGEAAESRQQQRTHNNVRGLRGGGGADAAPSNNIIAPVVAIGVATARFRLDRRLPGWCADSIGLHGDDGCVYHASAPSAAPLVAPFGGRVGDVVGCGVLRLPCGRRGVFFTLNGAVAGGPGARGADPPASERPPPYHPLVKVFAGDADLYPTIGLDARATLRANFGQEPFRNLDLVRDAGTHAEWARRASADVEARRLSSSSSGAPADRRLHHHRGAALFDGGAPPPHGRRLHHADRLADQHRLFGDNAPGPRDNEDAQLVFGAESVVPFSYDLGTLLLPAGAMVGPVSSEPRPPSMGDIAPPAAVPPARSDAALENRTGGRPRSASTSSSGSPPRRGALWGLPQAFGGGVDAPRGLRRRLFFGGGGIASRWGSPTSSVGDHDDRRASLGDDTSSSSSSSDSDDDDRDDALDAGGDAPADAPRSRALGALDLGLF